MAGKPPPPDYDLADRIALTAPSQVKALSHPLRTTILALLHERAASVSELAVALERPKSTVAHHVKVLAEAGLVRVVRTRRVRAIEERFYGRTARMFYVAVERSADGEARGRGRAAPAVGRDRLWIRGRRLSQRPSDATERRRVGQRRAPSRRGQGEAQWFEDRRPLPLVGVSPGGLQLPGADDRV